MKRTNKYWNEIAGYLSREMESEQIEKFLLKIKDNQHLKKDYELMKKTWNELDSNPYDRYSDTTSAWANLNERIVREGNIVLEKPILKMNSLNYFIRIAAVILLILAVGIPTVYYSVNGFGNNSPIQHRSENGSLTVDLPDGSRVYLNAGSNLEYKKDFEDQRDLKLEGEAYFDVMSDPRKPFRVNTGKVVVTVLGTSFNVRETKDNMVQVFVESGKVRMDLKKDSESLILTPGQLGEANGHLKTRSQDDANYLSWKTKDFKFVDEPVEKILEVLQESYHVDVHSDIPDLNEMRLTTSYSDQSFEAILATICTALNINFEKEGKVYILHQN